MNRWYRRLGFAALLTVVAAAPARADGSRLWTVCGGSHATFSTCASVQIDVVGTQVSLRVLNLSGLFGSAASYIFTRLGLDNVNTAVAAVPGTAINMTGPKRLGDSPAPWTIFNDQTSGGGINVDFGGTTPKGNVHNGIASSCAPAGSLPGGTKNHLWMTANQGCAGGYALSNAAVNGGWVHFKFNVTQTFDPNAPGTVLYVKAQNGPGGASTECITAGKNANCAPVTVVPEPVSMALMGTALLGVGAAARRRRRDPASLESDG